MIGRIFWEGAVARLAPRARRARAGLDDLLAARFLDPRAPFDDLRRARLPLQARPDPRRRLRRAREGGSRRAPSQVADWLHERTGEELIEIRAYHLDQAAALLEELDGTVPAELAARGRGGAREGRPARARARGEPLRAAAAASRGRARADARAPVPRRPCGARLADLPALALEMERVFDDATEAGDSGSRAGRSPRSPRSRCCATPTCRAGASSSSRHSALLEDGKPEDRFEALRDARAISWWLGDLDDDERWIGKALEVAREIGRKDLEARPPTSSRAQRSPGSTSTGPSRSSRRRSSSPRRAATSTTLGWALVSQARIDSLRGHSTRRRPRSTRRRAALLRVGQRLGARPRAQQPSRLGRAAPRRPAAAERRFRDAIRILKPLEDRGTLCESQRGLAQVLVARGKIDEAERYALEARETVGPHDTISRATTRMALGWCAPRRAATRRPRSCCARRSRSLADDRLRLIRASWSRRSSASCATAAARTRPRATRRDRDRAASSPSRVEHRPDRLVDSSSGDSRDHRRRPVEARQRLAERLGAQGSFAVGRCFVSFRFA